MRDELDISCLVDSALQAGKVAALPRYCPEIRAYGAGWITTPLSEVPVGKFGIREPATSCSIAPLNQLDLVLVPGLAFDGRGARLGHGRGFYDRLLAEVQGIKCGVGFDEQFISDVPVEAHDILLDVMLTPTRWLAFGPARAT
jgi:5-formyltetrahydrofolate cyclo-ligase